MTACRLPLYFNAGALQRDLTLIEEEEWVSHYNEDDFEGQWRGVALRAMGGQTANLRALPGAHMLYLDTPLLERCPAFAEVLANFGCVIGAARLLSLAPGSIIREHCDARLSHADGEVRIHIPVQTDADVEFYSCGERVAMGAGETWYLDFSQPHRVENRSSQYRVHLILDCALNPWLDALLQSGDNAS